jgi:lactoylglutathione lyase
MAKIIHSMIRVLDPGKAMEFYANAFNLKEKRRHDFETFSLIYIGNDENDFEIELTVNHDASKPYSHGTGYGHIAVCVDDLDAEHARISSLGYEPRNIVEFCPGGDLLARFFFVADPDGYDIEVIERRGPYQ